MGSLASSSMLSTSRSTGTQSMSSARRDTSRNTPASSKTRVQTSVRLQVFFPGEKVEPRERAVCHD